MKILLASLLVLSAAQAETTSINTNFAIGGDGLNVSVPPVGPNIKVVNQGNGVYSSTFSLTGNPVGARQAVIPIIRLSPAASAPSALSDPDTFFSGIGKPAPQETPTSGRSRR